jgi:hypothetical protein
MNKYLLILLLSCFVLCASAREQSDSTAIYQGMSIKLDLANPVLELVRSKGSVQDYEMALNVRLANRFYPTLELGYAKAALSADGGDYSGQGGFARIGMDLSALKKGGADNCLMIGLRFGGAYQGFELTNVPVHSEYWQMPNINFLNQKRFDCWGEIVGGCQVQIWNGFQMGWYVRIKLLMTRVDKHGAALPGYIPGFGHRRDTNWGLSYFLGWRF